LYAFATPERSVGVKMTTPLSSAPGIPIPPLDAVNIPLSALNSTAKSRLGTTRAR
jgi:hypothetical protein